VEWRSGTVRSRALGILTAALFGAAACSGQSIELPPDAGGASGESSVVASGGSTVAASGGSSAGRASGGRASAGGPSSGGSTAGRSNIGESGAGGRSGAGADGGSSGAGGSRGGTAGRESATEGGAGGEGGDGNELPGCRTLDEVFAVDRASLEALSDVCRITWVLHVRGNVDDLLPLSNLVQLAAIDVVGSNLTSLDGLENVTSTEYLLLQNNALLSDLDALRNLTRARVLSLEGNDGLENLEALANVRELDELLVMNNPALESLSGLRNALGSIEVSVGISNNDALVDLDGLGGLRADALYVADNDLLTDLRGVAVAPTINTLAIRGNASLTSVDGVENLEVASYFYVSDNPVLSDLSAFENLTHVFAELELSNNDALTALHGFENLELARNLLVADHDGLADLDGFSRLSGVHNLTIDGNLALGRLRGLSALEGVVEWLTVTDNPALPTCEAEALRDRLGINVGFGSVIERNDPFGVCSP
jgi:Leucine-rich repeat (LRR) protein